VRKVAVIGTASGTGKTTVGRALADRLGVPFVELDALHHGPDWTEATPDELRARVEPIVDTDAWVIDGAYRGKHGNREELRYVLHPTNSVVLYALRHHRATRRRYSVELARFPVVRVRTQAAVDRFLNDAIGRASAARRSTPQP